MANQLLSAPQAGSPIISFEDGWRLYERYPCHLPTSCQPASTWGNPESKWASTILNISTAGICLNVARRFEKGTGLAIELPADSGRQAYTVLGKVVYVRPQKDGSWTHGCAFLSELNEDEIQRLLDASEKRRSVTQLPRRAADRQVYSNVHCELEIHPGTIISYTINRLASVEPWPLPPGKIVTLRGGVKDAFWGLQAVVENCQHVDDRWTLQCRMLIQPTVQELLLTLGRMQEPQE